MVCNSGRARRTHSQTTQEKLRSWRAHSSLIAAISSSPKYTDCFLSALEVGSSPSARTVRGRPTLPLTLGAANNSSYIGIPFSFVAELKLGTIAYNPLPIRITTGRGKVGKCTTYLLDLARQGKGRVFPLFAHLVAHA